MFPHLGSVREFCMQTVGSYLKKHAEALVKDVGIENAFGITDKSKATVGRDYSDNPEDYDRYMPIDAVAAYEKTASSYDASVDFDDFSRVHDIIRIHRTLQSCH